jgi:peptidoglycan/LPS O-acetylase OafA/YrhL
LIDDTPAVLNAVAGMAESERATVVICAAATSAGKSMASELASRLKAGEIRHRALQWALEAVGATDWVELAKKLAAGEAWAMPLMPLIIWSGRSTIRAILAVSVIIAAARFNLNVIYFTTFIAGSYFATSSFRVDFLERPLPQWLGRISYSLYLTHCVAYRAVDHFLASPITPLLLIPACLVTAQTVWFLVENPSIQASRRVAKALAQANVAVLGVVRRYTAKESGAR